MNLPSPTVLRTFRKAFELRNFTSTAKALSMTQSGVSQHVAQLEELLGTALFERAGRGLLPTKTGEAVYRFAGSWLGQMEELIAVVREGEKRLAGRIVVGAPGSYGVVLLRALVEWQKRNPELIIDIEYGPNSVLERELASGRMDLAVTSAPLDPRLFHCEEFYRQEYILVSHPDLKPRFDSYESFAAQPFVDYVGSENIVELWCSEHFKDRRAVRTSSLNVRAKINNMESIFYLLEQKAGFTVFPKEPLLDFLRMKRLKAHKTGRQVLNPLFVCRRHGQRASYRVQVLKEIIARTP